MTQGQKYIQIKACQNSYWCSQINFIYSFVCCRNCNFKRMSVGSPRIRLERLNDETVSRAGSSSHLHQRGRGGGATTATPYRTDRRLILVRDPNYETPPPPAVAQGRPPLTHHNNRHHPSAESGQAFYQALVLCNFCVGYQPPFALLDITLIDMTLYLCLKKCNRPSLIFPVQFLKIILVSSEYWYHISHSSFSLQNKA